MTPKNPTLVYNFDQKLIEEKLNELVQVGDDLIIRMAAGAKRLTKDFFDIKAFLLIIF